MASNTVLIRETLAWCNRLRKRNGKKPLAKLPKGVKNDAMSCPCGKACGLAVYSDGAYEDHSDDWGWDMPAEVRIARTNKFVAEFIERFDNGDIPEQDLEPITE